MNEITPEYIREYLLSMAPGDEDRIRAMEDYAVKENVPIIKHEVKSFLQFFLGYTKPKKILEIGTAIGYSATLMSDILEDDVEITTIERNSDMIALAKANFKAYNKTNITLLEGDANDILKTLEGSYDMVFMDAAKGQYMAFLPYCIKRLRVNGVLISDNVLQDGFIAKSRWSIPRRQRTIHKRMRQYLRTLKTHEQLNTTIMPIADGMAVSYKLDRG